MSKVATTTTRTAGPRHVPYPTPNSRNVPTASTSTSTSTSQRRPPPRAEYRVDRIIHKGVPTEVLTIEDTPPLPNGAAAGPSNHARQTASYASSSKYDSSYEQPAAKKRKSDGAHISDQPYAPTSSGSSYRHNGQNGHAQYANGSGSGHVNGNGNGYSSKNKRKLETYEDYSPAAGTGSGKQTERSSQKVKPTLPISDKDGHFIVRTGDIVGNWPSYRIKKLLGQGTFGKVVHGIRVAGPGPKEVAIKIIRNVPKYREASKVEVNVLTKLAKADPDNKKKCIHLLAEFDHLQHVCLTSELLSSSVFDFLKENQYHPFPFSQIQHFAKQLLESIEFIHGLNYIHTDLKPENILLEDADFTIVDGKKSKKSRILKNSAIRLIDFGSATLETDYHATVVSTRHYRAPEIILGTGWSFPCDIWSIGCILIEFYTGEALFQTHENVEHLAMMRRVFGEMPDAFIQKAIKSGTHAEWFRRVDSKDRIDRTQNPTQTQILDFPVASTPKQSVKFVKQMRKLSDIVPSTDIRNQRFADLLERLLRWEPERRISVQDALRHPFFLLKISDEGSAAVEFKRDA